MIIIIITINVFISITIIIKAKKLGLPLWAYRNERAGTTVMQRRKLSGLKPILKLKSEIMIIVIMIKTMIHNANHRNYLWMGKNEQRSNHDALNLEHAYHAHDHLDQCSWLQSRLFWSTTVRWSTWRSWSGTVCFGQEVRKGRYVHFQMLGGKHGDRDHLYK